MKKEKILLINTTIAELHISGFVSRFIGLWCHIQKKESPERKAAVHWFTNKSLWDKYFPGIKQPGNVTVISANLSFFKLTARLFYPFFIVWVYYRKKCTSVHIANTIINPFYLVRLFNLLGIPYCFTFASNSIEMASYKSKVMLKRWPKFFRIAKNIDVLNPTNTINTYRGKKFVSPTSFPYLTEIFDMPESRFLNKQRENVIVFCGSLIEQKNPLLALEGFYAYLKEIQNGAATGARLVFIGKGDQLEMLQQKAATINQEIGRKVIEFREEDELIDTLSSAKLFLSLQDYDNYPSQSLMEAMLFCHSVIATNNGDTRKLVRTENKNILLEHKDPKQLGKGIHDILFDWELNTSNRELILTEFSARIFADYFFDIHRQIAADKK